MWTVNVLDNKYYNWNSWKVVSRSISFNIHQSKWSFVFVCVLHFKINHKSCSPIYSFSFFFPSSLDICISEQKMLRRNKLSIWQIYIYIYVLLQLYKLYMLILQFVLDLIYVQKMVSFMYRSINMLYWDMWHLVNGFGWLRKKKKKKNEMKIIITRIIV